MNTHPDIVGIVVELGSLYRCDWCIGIWSSDIVTPDSQEHREEYETGEEG